ncbi:glycerophosphodiester phosphodiesterase [Myxococcota bacterium]|nr:glycerophosphodiester phosphodiesterase [Myxococcota bacterium]
MTVLGGVFVVAALSAAAPGEGRSMRTIEVQGHRGARAVLPENTLPAFARALEVGAHTLELDVLVTKDDVLVVGHDPILSPDICLGPGGARLTSDVRVRDLTLAALAAYDCGTLKSPRFPRQQPVPKTRMPTLDEVFALVKTSKLAAAKTVKLNVEAKSVPGQPELAPPPERFAELLVGAFEESGLLSRVTLQSFDHRILRAAKVRSPKLVLAALVSDNHVDFVALAKGLGAEIVSPDRLWITKPDVDALHAAGVRVIPWTANDEAEWKRLVDLGVDGIITDDPEGLLTWLRGPR